MSSRFTAGFVVALLLSGCSGGGQPTTSGITSVLVMKHGRIVRESYYGGLEAGDRLPVFSITKSVTSALVGIAIADGSLSGLGERLPWRRLRPRELLAFGELYLEGGRRIVPASWVRLSTLAHVRIRHGLGYGYGWWIRPHSYAAYGYLGQVLAIYPKRDEVVLVTSSREDARPLELVRRIARE